MHGSIPASDGYKSQVGKQSWKSRDPAFSPGSHRSIDASLGLNAKSYRLNEMRVEWAQHINLSEICQQIHVQTFTDHILQTSECGMDWHGRFRQACSDTCFRTRYSSDDGPFRCTIFLSEYVHVCTGRRISMGRLPT